jgi:hypothetical protein
MQWRSTELFTEVARFIDGKTIARDNIVEYPAGNEATGIEFTDGTKVVCESRWGKDYSEYTPGDAEPPLFHIYS